jgi:precorrin-6A/cobalt-precorrin-6A reductase
VTHGPVLVLGGTGDARALAEILVHRQIHVVSSLAGRVQNPRLPAGEVRIGGFGGADGLARWLQDEEVLAVVDATHPFAEHISASALAACDTTGVPLLRLERPPWRARRGDDWRRVHDLDRAAAEVRCLGRRVFLTTGRQGIAAFADIDTAWFLIRCVDPPTASLPPQHELILNRGPYTLASELEMLDRHSIDLLVTKDSGGPLTMAKLDAARMRGLPVIMIDRPRRAETATVSTVAAALAWVGRVVA